LPLQDSILPTEFIITCTRQRVVYKYNEEISRRRVPMTLEKKNSTL
jgi:hypothetical protein